MHVQRSLLATYHREGGAKRTGRQVASQECVDRVQEGNLSARIFFIIHDMFCPWVPLYGPSHEFVGPSLLANNNNNNKNSTQKAFCSLTHHNCDTAAPGGENIQLHVPQTFDKLVIYLPRNARFLLIPTSK